jgi:cyclic pyranopterin phosphate synthase
MKPTPADRHPSSGALEDRFGRVARSLRVSVTDRCNLRCLYCMPAGQIDWFPRESILTFEEIYRVVEALTRVGVRDVRLTGGEPLMRRDLPVLVRKLASIEGIEDLSVTTNGLLLASMAKPLLEAGVMRFNVHIDSLEQGSFEAISRRDSLAEVIEGLAELERLGVSPIKVNVVIVRGVNDHEIPRFARMARRNPYQIRFIEQMPLGGGEPLDSARFVPGSEVRRRLEAIQPLLPIGRERCSSPAELFRFADGLGDVGFIDPVTKPFCATCDRIRLTADGMIRNCLFARDETDLRPFLRGGASAEELIAAVRAEVAAKGPGGCLDLHTYFTERLQRKMWQIGG